jgi:hypothetical protein
MAEIINPKSINTKSDAIAAAQKVVESQRAETEARRFEFEKFM